MKNKEANKIREIIETVERKLSLNPYKAQNSSELIEMSVILAIEEYKKGERK